MDDSKRVPLDVKGLNALDLTTLKPNGEAWDFNKKADRQLAVKMIDSDCPYWLILAPPCTSFCKLNRNINYRKMEKAKVDQLLLERRRHLHFAISLALRQIRAGRHFLFEHPLSAASWEDPSLKSLMSIPRIYTTVCDQCEYGLVVRNTDGEEQHARKATRFVTSSPFMAHRLSTRCKGDHQHHALHGKQLEQAAFYPAKLRLQLLRGMRDTSDHDRAKEEETDQDIALLKATRSCAEPNNSFPETVAAAIRREDASKKKPDPVTPFKFQSGGRQAIALEQNLKEKYLDEYTREVLPPDLMKEAIRDELAWLNVHVWEGVPMDEVKLQSDAIVVGTRWVMCNKGDIANPDMRARLVAQEVAHEREDSYFAATPPLEAKRALISQMATERTRGVTVESTASRPSGRHRETH